ncbi:MAG: DUF188 domain-containing protein [Spirochaetales bacterium]|nr:DUF188 domain-containing protein [Spirochaetales bacterium]
MPSEHLILVDSDSCPRPIRAVVLRSCRKNRIAAVFCADRALPDVRSQIADDTGEKRREYLQAGGEAQNVRSVRSLIRMLVVSSGQDSADDALVDLCTPGCLAITRDLPLASRLIQKGACAVITDRGVVLDSSNIAEKLSERNANAVFREAGLFDAGREQHLTPRDIKAFSDAFSARIQILLHQE